MNSTVKLEPAAVVSSNGTVAARTATFAILAALFFWFPKMFARPLNERLGKVHFWITFVGVYAVFLPMHWLGLLPARASASEASGHTAMLTAALLTIGGQLVFFANLAWTLGRRERLEERNPWRATTLEWSLPSPPPAEGFGATAPAVYRGAYEFRALGASAPARQEDFWPQHLAPGDAASH